MKQEKRKSSFHDHEHALEFDQRAGRSDVRAKLGLHLLDALQLMGGEWVLDIATGTGRFAKPVSEGLKGGRVIGLDQALAMLSVAHDMASRESICRQRVMRECCPFVAGFLTVDLWPLACTTFKIRLWRYAKLGAF